MRFLSSIAVENGVVQVFDHIEGDGPMWNATARRSESVDVLFSSPFAAPPAVQLSVAMIDADTGRNLRLELRAEGITGDGFKAVAKTWDDTRLGRLTIHWLAIGASRTAPEWDV